MRWTGSILILSMIAFLSIPGFSHAQQKLRVEPNEVDVTIDDFVNVDIIARNIPNLSTFEFRISFNRDENGNLVDILEALRVEQGADWDAGYLWHPGKIDNASGSIGFISGAAHLSSAPYGIYINNNGNVLATITFRAVANGVSSINLADALAYDSNGSKINLYSGTTTQQYSISLSAGRNLISFPLQPQDTSRDVILAPILDKIISVWWLDPVIGWRWYKPGEPSNFGDVMEAGVGYWMNVTEDTSLIIQGTPPPTTIALNDGRNLVGYNLLEPKGIEAAMASIHPNYSKVWAFLPVFGWRWYDPANPGGSNLWELSPGMGIWLNSIGSQIWDVDP